MAKLRKLRRKHWSVGRLTGANKVGRDEGCTSTVHISHRGGKRKDELK